MGYLADDPTVTVRFAEGHRYHGLEVTLRGMDIRTYLSVTGMDGSDPEGVGNALKRFAGSLVAWNLERRDPAQPGNPVVPVPATADEVWRQDHRLILALSEAWIDALAGVHDADPLAPTSPAGVPSLAESIPTEPLTESLVS